MRMFLVAALTCLFVGEAIAESDKSIETIRKTLTKYSVVQGKYSQVRELKDLGVKLNSNGEFKFQQPSQLNLKQKVPFEMSLDFSKDKILQKNADGSVQTITLKEQPAIFAFSSSFLNVIGGDASAIEKSFSAVATMNGERWTLALTPKEELFKKIISKITLSGGHFLESVRVEESTGNKSELIFTQVKGSH